MTFTYEVMEELKVIKRSDGAFIPMDESNSDYQEYLNPSEAKTI
jgi:hypothetical protein